jgi:Kef-type K+ transport system membrane component KefB
MQSLLRIFVVWLFVATAASAVQAVQSPEAQPGPALAISGTPAASPDHAAPPQVKAGSVSTKTQANAATTAAPAKANSSGPGQPQVKLSPAPSSTHPAFTFPPPPPFDWKPSPPLPPQQAIETGTPPPILLEPPPRLPAPSKRNIEQTGLESASEVIKVILGLVFISGLAYLAGHPRVQEIERKLQISQVVTAGLPFVLLGVIAHLPGVGILSQSVLWEIRPLLALGLGWIGFTIGFRFDSRLADSLVPGASTASLITASIPFATILGLCVALLLFIEHPPTNLISLRDAMMLATAGAMTAYGAPEMLEARGAADYSVDRVASIVTLEQLAGFVGLMLVAAYFRPQDSVVAWRLPGTAWLFITLGMGTMIGGVIYGTLGKVQRGPEFSVLVLGSVCFTAGMASFLRLSPLVVCFIVGLILVNLPGRSKDRIREALNRMERPIYLLFLLVAGSLWDVTEWQGWALMVLFVVARLLGKWLAVIFCRKRVPGGLTTDEQRSLILSPIGALSIAIVVNAQDLYSGPTVSWMVTAVIGGAIVTEIIVQIAARHSEVDEPHLIGIS